MTVRPGSLTAVIVLYERAPVDSEAFTSLERILNANQDYRAAIRLILYDNSTTAASPTSTQSVASDYIHDATNRGLATAYNYALGQAQFHQSEWVLLIDQDTTLTEKYISELLATSEACRNVLQVAAIVPILEMHDKIYSPEADFFYTVRHQFPHLRYFPVARICSGIQQRPLTAYNSGAAFRVTALEAIGGFPLEFRIDFLDHAVFQQLHRQGWSLFVLPTILQQKLAHIDLNSVSLARHTSVLQMQTLFVARYGTWMERLLFRLWLFRKSLEYRELCNDPTIWRNMARQALGKWRFSSTEPIQ